MTKLFVAGDSFASLCKSQDLGSSWSELLAKELGHYLINISRPGVSNESISIQIDYIADKVTSNDLVIIFLTDSFRKTLVDSDADLTHKHLLEYHSLHESQNYVGDKLFQEVPTLKVYTHLNARKTSEANFYFKRLYNYQYQKYIDKTLLTGALCKLSTKTTRFKVVLNGFNDESYTKPYWVRASTFCIKEENFINLPSSELLKSYYDPTSINHMSYAGHQKVYEILLNSIAE